MPPTPLDTLRRIYDDATVLAEGYAAMYRGYTLRKVETDGLGVEHSEFAVLNRNGTKVESYTLGAFDSLEEFADRLNELIDHDPDSLSDWLNRDK